MTLAHPVNWVFCTGKQQVSEPRQLQFWYGEASTKEIFFEVSLTMRLFVSKLGNIGILTTFFIHSLSTVLFFRMVIEQSYMWLWWNKIFCLFIGFHFSKLIILICSTFVLPDKILEKIEFDTQQVAYVLVLYTYTHMHTHVLQIVCIICLCLL